MEDFLIVQIDLQVDSGYKSVKVCKSVHIRYNMHAERTDCLAAVIVADENKDACV